MTPVTAELPTVVDRRGPSGTHRLFAAGNDAGLAAHGQAFGALPSHGIDACASSTLWKPPG
ncbi:hypothetical protein [Arthrobacter sp. A5]|uniref:hypothetical protein n=1 Tax=Arthrobacter sp. A5 TaxID=576926 RepID=UPI003DA7D368